MAHSGDARARGSEEALAFQQHSHLHSQAGLPLLKHSPCQQHSSQERPTKIPASLLCSSSCTDASPSGEVVGKKIILCLYLTLQSQHFPLFRRLNHYMVTPPVQTFRLSVEVNRSSLTLQDYDNITRAVSAAFALPELALVFAGCLVDPLVLVWLVPAQLLEYVKTAPAGSLGSSDRLLFEQGVVAVAVGDDVHIKCIGIKVCLYNFRSFHCVLP